MKWLPETTQGAESVDIQSVNDLHTQETRRTDPTRSTTGQEHCTGGELRAFKVSKDAPAPTSDHSLVQAALQGRLNVPKSKGANLEKEPSAGKHTLED